MKQFFAKGMVLITVIFMDLLTGMEFDLFVPSFPQLQNHFNLSPFWVEASLSVNFMGYCLSLFLVGGLADRHGRKPIILLGLISFIIGSFLCVFSFFYELLLLGRFLQGIGIAAPAILSFLIIADAYSLKEQQFLMAMLNGLINIAVAISPVLGSYLTLYFHWQGNFIALLLLGLITLMMTIFFIPFRALPLNDAMLPGGGYMSIVKSKPLMLLIINILFISVPYWIFVGMSPLLYIRDLSVSLAHFGYYQGILAFVFAIGSVFFGLAIKEANFNQKKMLVFSLKILIISLIIIVWVTLLDSVNALIITLAFLPFIISQIIPSVILYPLSLNFLLHVKARVSAVIQGARLILTALALQIAGYFYQKSFKSIGVVLICFMVIAVITLFFIIKNRELMEWEEK
ncbi:MAG: MFS-type bicyclomycin resistance protein [Gammaproteobacteria bacterium]|jgi:DHA1 family bicyclomycin/chloramphenicol resistance-like MFS transporter|nr:MFS-type bicyclomycin resistance protein [Gammaproteobacteria bacterium]